LQIDDIESLVWETIVNWVWPGFKFRVESSEMNSLKRPREIEGIAIGIFRVYRNRIGDK
jgi:hypothetical protein